MSSAQTVTPVLSTPSGLLKVDDEPLVLSPVSPAARRWIGLAVGSLVVAGLLSLLVVVGRLPILSSLIADPLFFKRCLVVHVDLALVVWFYSFLAGLQAMHSRDSGQAFSRMLFGAAVAGVIAMLAGAVVPGSQPILSNYIPVIDHPVFLAGLLCFFLAIVLMAVRGLACSAIGQPGNPGDNVLPTDASTAVLASCLAVVLAFATWVSTEAGLPTGLGRWTRFEFSAWGAGHVLQVANVCAMLAIWLWILARATGRQVLSPRAARLIFAFLVAPHFVMPLLTLRGPLDPLYHTGATQLMRWGVFPVTLLVLALGIRHLGRHREPSPSPGLQFAGPASVSARRAILAGFRASVLLTLLGFILGACIRGSTTLVPAHYHASLGGVTAAFMTAAFLIADRIRLSDTRYGLADRTWLGVRRQLTVFGAGQAVFALGFAVGGLYGLGRKTYGTEQHIRSTGELTGLVIMGAGGLVATVAGVWFLVLILREIRHWWRRRPAEASHMANPQPPQP